jgi:hypothetical protein
LQIKEYDEKRKCSFYFRSTCRFRQKKNFLKGLFEKSLSEKDSDDVDLLKLNVSFTWDMKNEDGWLCWKIKVL